MVGHITTQQVIQRFAMTVALVSMTGTSVHAQFGLGPILSGGRSSSPMSQGGSGGMGVRGGPFPPRFAPPVRMPGPPPGVRVSPRPSLGNSVGQAVISSAMDTIQNRIVRTPPATVGAPRPRPTQPINGGAPSSPPCCPPHASPQPPANGGSTVVVVPGAGTTSGTVYYAPADNSSAVVAQTPVTADQTVTSSSPENGQVGDEAVRTLIALVEESKQLFRQQRYRDSIAQLDQAIELAPENSDVLQFRGVAYFALGDFDAAAADVYDSLLYGNTWNWEAVYDLYKSRDRYEQQLRKLEQARRAAPSMSTHFLLGYHYLVLNHLPRGRKELNGALGFQPSEPLLVKLVAAVDQRVASDSQ